MFVNEVCTTYLDTEGWYTYKWIINDFTFHLEEPGECISLTMSSGKSELQLRLDLYPNGIDIDHEKYVSLILMVLSMKVEFVYLKYSICLINSLEDFFNIHRGTQKTTNEEGYNYPTFISREALFKDSNKFLPDNKLTLVFRMLIVNDSLNVRRRNVKVPQCRLSDELAGLLENEKFSDVIIAADGKEIQAHKNILAARSPVFAAMFEHEMEERKRNRVDITDVDHEVLREMLRYIYTGRAPNIAKVANGLLAAADKYSLHQLKAMCEEALSNSLQVETAVDSLILADLHSANKLKAETINFINTKPLEVMKTAGWKNVVTSHSHILEEVYKALVTTIIEHN